MTAALIYDTATDTYPGGLLPMDVYGWRRVINAGVESRRLPRQAGELARVLEQFADRDGSNIFPGVDRLAARIGCSRSTVKRWTAVLVAAGLVYKVKQGDRWRHKADEYQLTAPTDPGRRIDVVQAAVWSDQHPEPADPEPMSGAHSGKSGAHLSPCLGLTPEPPPTQYQPTTNPADPGGLVVKVGTDRATPAPTPTRSFSAVGVTSAVVPDASRREERPESTDVDDLVADDDEHLVDDAVTAAVYVPTSPTYAALRANWLGKPAAVTSITGENRAARRRAARR